MVTLCQTPRGVSALLLYRPTYIVPRWQRCPQFAVRFCYIRVSWDTVAVKYGFRTQAGACASVIRTLSSYSKGPVLRCYLQNKRNSNMSSFSPSLLERNILKREREREKDDIDRTKVAAVTDCIPVRPRTVLNTPAMQELSTVHWK